MLANVHTAEGMMFDCRLPNVCTATFQHIQHMREFKTQTACAYSLCPLLQVVERIYAFISKASA
jgi:hypothetical protein